MSYYRVKGMPGLSGLIVRCDEDPLVATGDIKLHVVRQIINSGVIVGDTDLKWPIDDGSLFINERFLEKIDFVEKGYSYKNTFGKFLFSGNYTKEDIEVVYAKYENCLSVTLFNAIDDKKKTIYAQNFFGNNSNIAVAKIEGLLSNDSDIDDLIFVLKELEEERLNG